MKIKQFLTFIILAALTACWSPDGNRTTRNNSSPGSTTSSSPTPSSTAGKTSNNNGDTSNVSSSNKTTETPKSGGFQGNLPGGFQTPTDAVGQKMLKEYGAMFVAKGVTPPSVVVFKNEGEVSAFQTGVQKSSENIGGVTIEL